jgi:hypothetical protein
MAMTRLGEFDVLFKLSGLAPIFCQPRYGHGPA